jgi:SRSO17 transposase
MTTDQILGLGPELATFLAEFADCFGRSEPRGKLETYVRGQLGQLPRKSVEPIALAAGLRPRTLQEFLASDEWAEDRLAAHVRRLVVRDHGDDQAIGVIDESGHPKKGEHTAGVARQYCGHTGHVDNCVMTVHLTYTSFDNQFRAMLDSSLYLPQSWHEDRGRCRQARIPDDCVYRTKYAIALEQLDRAVAEGVRFAWITADEWYAQKGAFVRGLEERGQRFVLEIPTSLCVWLQDPASEALTAALPVKHVCRFGEVFLDQPWEPYYLKDTDKGPVVWEVKFAACWRPRGKDVVGPYWLVMARNVLEPSATKYFLSNAAPGVPLPVILHVAFSRWSVERCLEDEKSEVGLSHFEVRCYPALQRHLLITQVSHLFLACQAARLREKKSPGHASPGPSGHQRLDRCAAPAPARAPSAAGPRCTATGLLARPQRSSSTQPHENTPCRTRKTPHPPGPTTSLPTSLNSKSAL